MKPLYTINYKLFASYKGEDTLLDAQISTFIYKTRESAFKAVQERIKTHIELSGYKPTRSQFVIESEKDTSGQTFRIEFEIKEHYISEFEKES